MMTSKLLKVKRQVRRALNENLNYRRWKANLSEASFGADIDDEIADMENDEYAVINGVHLVEEAEPNQQPDDNGDLMFGCVSFIEFQNVLKNMPEECIRWFRNRRFYYYQIDMENMKTAASRASHYDFIVITADGVLEWSQRLKGKYIAYRVLPYSREASNQIVGQTKSNGEPMFSEWQRWRTTGPDAKGSHQQRMNKLIDALYNKPASTWAGSNMEEFNIGIPKIAQRSSPTGLMILFDGTGRLVSNGKTAPCAIGNLVPADENGLDPEYLTWVYNGLEEYPGASDEHRQISNLFKMVPADVFAANFGKLTKKSVQSLTAVEEMIDALTGGEDERTTALKGKYGLKEKDALEDGELEYVSEDEEEDLDEDEEVEIDECGDDCEGCEGCEDGECVDEEEEEEDAEEADESEEELEDLDEEEEEAEEDLDECGDEENLDEEKEEAEEDLDEEEEADDFYDGV